MLKLKYTIFDALINFYKRRSFNFIVSVSFALGMLLPILCIGNINVFVENVSTMRFKNDTNIWIAYFDGEHISPKEIYPLIQEGLLKIKDFAISAYKSGTIEINGTKKNGFASYLTENWVEFENCKLIDGSLDIFSGTNLCLIEQSLFEENDCLHIGDEITLFGATYTVNGVFSSFHHYGKIVLPLSVSGQEAESDIAVSQLYLRTEEAIPDGIYIADTLKGAGLPVSDVRSGQELYHAGLTKGMYQSIGIFFVGFIAFAFAAINICLVLVGKLNLDKRTYGIRMAMGAPYSLVFLSALIENMLCFCIAFLLSVGLVLILKPTYPQDLTIILNAKVYVTAFLFGAFMTLAVTWIALYKLKKQKIVELFERVS